MRDSFCGALVDVASSNPRFMLLTADLGFGIFDEYVEKFPGQFLNVGVAEQSMIGVATGMAMSGWTIFAYSIGNFSTLRCLEQIRNDAAYLDANVTVVCSGGGFTYGNLGMSHHATEDLSIMRAVPGVTVVVPCDAWESAEATKALAAAPGVGYLRLEKAVPFSSEKAGETFHIGKARMLRDGRDVTLIAAGGIMAHTLAAADALQKEGVSARVVSMHTLTPLDDKVIIDAMQSTKAIVTVEENIIAGGLGGAVAEVVAECGRSVGFAGAFRRVGIKSRPEPIVGDQEFLRQRHEMDSVSIARVARDLVASVRSSAGLSAAGGIR